MNIGIHEIKIIEDIITEMGINLIRIKGQVIFHKKHFLTQNLTLIKGALENLM